MFKELIKLKELERLLKKGRFAEALALASDPSIRGHRRAIEAAERARQGLLESAGQRLQKGDLTRAFQDVRAVLRETEDAEARRIERTLRASFGEREARAQALKREIANAKVLADRGDLAEAIALLEPLGAEGPEAAQVLEGLRGRRDAALACTRKAAEDLGAGRFMDACGALIEARTHDARHPGAADLWRRLLDGARGRGDQKMLGQFLTETIRERVPQDAPLAESREKAGLEYLSGIEQLLAEGQLENAAAALERFPLGVPADAQAASLAGAVRQALRAKKLLEEGELRLAEEQFREALKALPPSPALPGFLKEIEATRQNVQEPLKEARAALSAGTLLRARTLLLDVLEKCPGNREAQDLLGAVEKQEAEDLETLRKARDLLGLGVEGSLDDCRRVLLALEARRPDLVEVPILLRDVDRRSREARLRSLDAATDRTVRLPDGCSPPAETPHEFGGAARPALHPDLLPGTPFVLRVEEQGDWFVHPKDSVLVGNSMRGVADLPVLAAIAGRHARIERRHAADGSIAYDLVVDAGRKVLRNRRPVTGRSSLNHGDVLSLGEVLVLTFLRPVPGNASVVLKIEGDFTVHGCRQVILFSESGRRGSIVIGPGPEAHVPLAREADRVEILRATEGEGSGMLWARGRRGVAVGEGSERPQVRVSPGQPVRAGGIAFFIDPMDRK